MSEYFGDGWQPILAANHLDNFDALWDLKTDWFEEPNIRRGGWSGVVKVDLDTPQGKVGVFIKRQQNHTTKTLLHPLKGRPTFEREFKNILSLRKYNLPTLEPVYFSKRNIKGDIQAILISKELSDYTPLDSERFLATGDIIKNTAHKNSLLHAVADTLRGMHEHHFQHNCFYLKHVFVKSVGNSWDIKIIDLEKLKWSFFKKNAVFRDLYTLQRHTQNWSKKDRVTFFKAYVAESSLSAESKSLWRSIEKKILSKQN
ncbi:MAG: lipopolysaccharide kinase [Gammaproteobacteria bacterium]|nr:lipopolysaccharide kinase [Gammaproteobacteria bacterium]